MADTIKSALFVDYDSFHRSQDEDNGDTAERLAQTSAVWVAALEGGKLIQPPPDDGARRRVLIRRCYADPALLGLHRSALIAAGFEVIDCPHQPGRKRNAADLHMVIDTIDALDHPAGYDEFILLSADADLTPVLLRLRAHNRNTVVYGDEATTASYKAIADGMVDAARFAAVLAGESLEEKVEASAPSETSESAEAGAATVPPDRNDIEALARKVHASTNVPMFSPRTFADLFRLLAQEIGEHGYHFQNTAENVSEKLISAGRNVNRRQVLFVVKGLALKGHVFSTTDTPERLAEVFREQVLYLIGNSGLDLDEREKAMLPNWIVGRTPSVVAKPPPMATPPRPVPPPEDAAKRTPPARRRVTRPAPGKEELAAPVAKAEPPRPEAPARSEPAADAWAPPPPPAAPPARPSPVAAAPGAAAPTPRADVRATVASRFAAITKGSFGSKPGEAAARPTPPAPPARPAAAEPRPAGSRPPPPRPTPPARPAAGSTAAKPAPAKAPPAPKAAPAAADDPLESSILAAIAQAVDVLVDDNGDKQKGRDTGREVEVEAAAIEAAAAPEPEPPPDPEPSPGGDSEDIGDEIQRIIASYSRARTQGD
jgi:hypothetical protein